MKRVLVVLTLLGAGCGLLTEPEDDLNDARARWAEAGLTSYSYQYSLSCFCGSPANRSLLVEVVNGQVTEAWDISTNLPLDPALLAGLPTVPGLFEIAERAVQEADRKQLKYDEFYGYPTLMDIDWISNAIDDEQVHRSDCLRPGGSEAARGGRAPPPGTSDPCAGRPE